MTEPADADPTPAASRSEGGHLQYFVLGIALLALILAALPYFGLGGSVRTSLLKHPEMLQEASEAYSRNLAQLQAETINARVAEHPAMLQALPGDAVIGPADAKVTVVEFYDFRCPGCKATAPGILQLVEAHPDVRFIFKDWPILDRGDPSGPSHRAAHAAAAALAQGQFLPVFRDLMAEGDLTDESINAILQRHGINPATAAQLAASPEMAQRLADTETAGLTLGLVGTPSFFVNGRMTANIEPATVEQAIAAAKGNHR